MDRKFKTITDRIEAVTAYLDSAQIATELAQQRHLDGDTSERAYWHAGYRSALIDALRLLADESAPVRKTDSAGDSLWAAPDGRSFH